MNKLLRLVVFAACLALVVCQAQAEAAAAKAKRKISQVIVLMMENRSFDHMLGYVAGVDGVTENMSCPVDPNDASKGSIPLNKNGFDVSPDDPHHDLDSIAFQNNNGLMNGFVQSQVINNQNVSNPVSMFDKSNAPIINTLAEEYAVFDKWFCSVPGPTDPNRQFAMSGTSLGITTNFNGTLYPQQSYLDYLRRNGRSSGGYYDRDLWMLGGFADFFEPENQVNIKELNEHFYTDLAAGQLPEFTWLQPSMTAPLRHKTGPNWQHPDASVLEGGRLIKSVYEAIRKSPKWEETLFFLTYDENGGFYDHVPPPSKGVPAPGGQGCVDCDDGYAFDSLGVRVPTIAISPWIAKGHVESDGVGPSDTSVYESTSLMATVNELLDVKALPLGERMAWASTFTHLITDTYRDDCITDLPELPEPVHNIAEIQRGKAINEHMLASLLMFCNLNYPQEFQAGSLCPAAVAADAAKSQGDASDWMEREQKAFFSKIQK